MPPYPGIRINPGQLGVIDARPARAFLFPLPNLEIRWMVLVIPPPLTTMPLTPEQESDLVGFIIEDFGTALNQADFTDSLLQMFEDIPGMECLEENQRLTIGARLWGKYRERRTLDS